MTLVYDIGIDSFSLNIDGMKWLYIKPWGRIGPYFIGALFGLTFFELSSKEKHPELSDTFINKIFDTLKKSRIISIVFAAVGIGITSLYVFSTQSYFQNCSVMGMTPKTDQ